MARYKKLKNIDVDNILLDELSIEEYVELIYIINKFKLGKNDLVDNLSLLNLYCVICDKCDSYYNYKMIKYDSLSPKKQILHILNDFIYLLNKKENK